MVTNTEDVQWQERLSHVWKAVPEDQIGGWCVVLLKEERTPAGGAPVIANFVGRSEALHIARVHNFWLKTLKKKGIPLDEDPATADDRALEP